MNTTVCLFIVNTAFSLIVFLPVNYSTSKFQAGIIFQSGRKERAYFVNSLETFNIIGLKLKRACRRLQNTILRCRKVHQYRIIYNNPQICVRHSRTIKNIRNSAIHCFLCNCGIIRTLCGLCETRNAGLLERRE